MRFYEYLASTEGRLLIWGVTTRGIGLAYVVCLGALLPQVSALIGSRGIMPVERQMRHMRRHLPWPQAIRLNPSVLWVARGDRAIRALVAVGVAAGAAVVWGGPASRLALLACWLVVLSLRYSVRMYYPWDSLLLEAGFLALFLPTLEALPTLETSAVPAPLLVFAFHFVVARVLFGFGKTKFVGVRRRDALYIKYFLMNKPMVTRLGWRLAHAPDRVHKAILGAIAFVELVCPVLVLFPGPVRLIGAAAIVGQMVGIQLSGNFGYFNMLTIVLCVGLLDHSSALTDVSVAELFTLSNLPFTVAFAVILAASPAYVAVNNWLTYGFADWPVWSRLRPGPLRAYFAFLRAITPLCVTQGYGVFGPRSGPPVRWLAVIEGSDDGGETWRAYEYRHTPTSGRSTPRFVAPHHPRLDHLTYYEAMGIDGTSYLSVVSFSDPYRFSRSALLDLAVQRLLEDGSPVPGLLRTNPFPARPPDLVRVTRLRAVPTTPDELAATGRWWHTQPAGFHILPTGRDETVDEDWLPPPERYHFEAMRWRRRAGVCDGVTARQLDDFWETFVPFVGDAAVVAENRRAGDGDPHRWENVPDVVVDLRRRFSRTEVREFHVVLARLTTAALARLDVVFARPAQGFWRNVAGLPVGRPAADPASLPADPDPEELLQALAASPHGPLRSWFRLGIAVHRTILTEGREGWERLVGPGFQVGAPIRTAVRLSRGGARSMAAAAQEIDLDLALLRRAALGLTVGNGFFLESVVNYDMVARQADRARVMFADVGFEPPTTGLAPGVTELLGELLEHPEIMPIAGWGASATFVPPAPLPRMRFGEDGRWTEEQRSDVGAA